MSIVLICPKCKGNAWVMLSTENKVCLDCQIPMVDAAQQMRGADGEPDPKNWWSWLRWWWSKITPPLRRTEEKC